MAALVAMAAAMSIAGMRDHRRVLIVAAPAADDPRLRTQRAGLAAWGAGAADRDLAVVEVVGRVVSGAADDAGSLRAAYHLPPGAFMVVLVGKDGHVAHRSGEPVSAAILQGTIDAMPMRRAGKR
ncbi:DUF4174 domain-containing protein [Sphingomonas bacterium]|uniref:DUF4174 domain-containing protein n=1 Tax=Sphingomonas bacterium TaxID=1895847 RepID=UPI001576F07D|nr:DUF4174 domain-containing protein [Sphingomonas bacterium]